MKEFMTLVWVLIFGASFIGCTTFNSNESGVRRACRSGVESYTNDTISFKCNEK